MRQIITFLSCIVFLSIPALSGYAQCNCPAPTTGPDYSNKDYTDYNFTTLGKDALVGANFKNSILKGAQFQNMNLTNANFCGAKMQPSQKGKTNLSGANLDHTCFTETDLTEANLQFSIFMATDFSNANLIGADFGPTMKIQKSTRDALRTRFNNTSVDFVKFPINRWPAAYWALTDMSYSRFSGMNSRNFTLRGKDISNAILKGINLTNFDLSHCKMTGVDLSDAILNYAIFDSSVMDQVQLVKAKLQYASFVKVAFYDSLIVSKGANLTGASLANAKMQRCDMRYVILSGANFLGATVTNCNLNNAAMESSGTYDAASLTGANLSYSSFDGAKMNGVNFVNSYLVSSSFKNITMNATNFQSTTAPDADFTQSVMVGVLFGGAILQKAKFNSCTFKTAAGSSGVDFSCTQLGGADFSSATVLQANFANAVVIPKDSCCKQTGDYFCGLIGINSNGYGPTVTPILKTAVTCPNGDVDTCSGRQWLIPGWQTRGCNQGHQMQTMWYKPDCAHHDTSEIVKFKDQALKKCVVDQIYNGDLGRDVTKQVAAQVTALSCPSRGISDLGGIEAFKSLQQLDVSGNNLTNGDAFVNIPQLHQLNVARNSLISLDLSGLQILVLDASNNQIATLSGTASSYFNYINLSNNKLARLDLSIQTNLNFADLSNNLLTDIDDISDLRNLSAIYLENNYLTTIGNVSRIYNKGAGNLQFMNLSCNPGFDCTSLMLNADQKEIDFKNSSLCGVNSLPGCRTSLPAKAVNKKKAKK